ncbi:hypothetical protein ACS0TY_032760 [Phlomoides rotata]
MSSGFLAVHVCCLLFAEKLFAVSGQQVLLEAGSCPRLQEASQDRARNRLAGRSGQSAGGQAVELRMRMFKRSRAQAGRGTVQEEQQVRSAGIFTERVQDFWPFMFAVCCFWTAGFAGSWKLSKAAGSKSGPRKEQARWTFWSVRWWSGRGAQDALKLRIAHVQEKPSSGRARSWSVSYASQVQEKPREVRDASRMRAGRLEDRPRAAGSRAGRSEETEHQVSKPDVSGQLSTSGVKEGEISLRPQKGPKQVDTNITGFKSCWWFNNTWESLLKGIEFRPEHFITNVSGKYPRLWTLKGANLIDVNRCTSLELSPQSVLLHQVFEKSQNYQIGFLM